MATLFLAEQAYQANILDASKKYGVPVELIMGHIKQESGFNPNAKRDEKTSDGRVWDTSYGMMQLLLKTAKGLDPNATPEKLYNPAYNIDLGTRLIAQNLKKYPNIPDAIAAYNAGVPRKNEKGEYVNSKGVPNVNYYVKQVTKYMNQYKDWLATGKKSVQLSWIDALIPIFIIGLAIYYFANRGEANAEGDNA